MTIASLDDYIAAPKQVIQITKTASRTSTAATPFNIFDLAGSPGAGPVVPGGGNNGNVPVDTDVGYPVINPFAVGAVGYVSRFTFSSTVAGRLTLYDRVWWGGQYDWNAGTVTVTTPSYSSRLPGGDFKGLQLWAAVHTALVGTLTLTVTYTNQSGTTGRVATASFIAAATLGRMLQLPLQAGDDGIQSIQSIQLAGATGGAVTLMILRYLAEGRVRSVNDGDAQSMLETGLPIVNDTAALMLIATPDSTATGIPSVQIEIASL